MKAILAIASILTTLVMNAQQRNIESTIERVNVFTGERKVIYQEKRHIEAPNWSRDGSHVVVNSGGLLYNVPLVHPKLEKLNTGFVTKCNNDHGLSPDGNMLAISAQDTAVKGAGSTIYILPSKGGEPKRVTQLVPSYWHGWSADGKTVAYCAERNGNFDVYTISVNGGEETRLTDAEGLDDGPDYSPDGKFIFYNSFASGKMHIWRMDADGKNKKQLTTDSSSNWFAHPSPDGRYLAYIAYLQDQGQQHPFGKDVQLRLMDLKDGSIKNITPVFFGGQGSFNVPSWSPDGKEVAFISYRLY